jgi:membrane associated rhomboid family serine protease
MAIGRCPETGLETADGIHFAVGNAKAVPVSACRKETGLLVGGAPAYLWTTEVREMDMRRDDETGGRPRTGEPVFDLPTPLIVLIGVLVAVQVARGFLSPASDGEVLATFAFVPDRFILENGGPPYPGGWGAMAWTFLSYGFLHDGWVHLGFNAAMLAALGRIVGARIGLRRTLVLLAVSGVIGAGFHLVANWGDGAPMIGASGAVSGLFGALPRFVFFPPWLPVPGILRCLAERRVRGFLSALVLANLVLVVFGTGPFGGGDGTVAWAVHLGGFLVGFLGFSWFDPADDRPSMAEPE